MEQKLAWKIYIGVIGAVTTIAAQKLITAGWKAITGDEPPAPTDPDTPIGVAVSWAIASGVGIGVTQLVTTPATIEPARALKPVFAETRFGQSVMVYDRVSRELLEPLGTVSTPTLSDLFVALMERPVAAEAAA